MVGLTFVRDYVDETTIDRSDLPHPLLQYEVIRVVDRELHHTRCEPTDRFEEDTATLETHDYRLHCICRRNVTPSAMPIDARTNVHAGDEYRIIPESQLEEEIARGLYSLAFGCFEVFPERA